MNKRINKLALLVASALISSSAFAEFKLIDGSTITKASNSPGVSQISVTQQDVGSVSLFGGTSEVSPAGMVTQIGLNKEPLKPIKGFAKDLPLITILKQITPMGWHAKKAGEIDVNQNASWKGGKNWVEILAALAKDYKFNAVINWDKNELTLSPIGYQAVAKEDKKVTLDKTTKVVTPREWILDSKASLSENVTEWGKTVNWNVVWLAVNYPIDVTAVLNGDFEADDGPIAQIAYAYKDASQPLVFDFKEGNRTLVVKNLEFEQKHVKDQRIK